MSKVKWAQCGRGRPASDRGSAVDGYWDPSEPELPEPAEADLWRLVAFDRRLARAEGLIARLRADILHSALLLLRDAS